MQGFYDALGGARAREKLRRSPTRAEPGTTAPVPSRSAAHASQYSAPLNAGNAYAAVIFSTPVTNSDNDGILDAWKSGPAGGRFLCGAAGLLRREDPIVGAVAGRQHGEKDLFVQLDYMCGAVLANGACDPSQENLFPSPDAQGNDPLAMVKQAFAPPMALESCSISKLATQCRKAPARITRPPLRRSYASSPASRE